MRAMVRQMTFSEEQPSFYLLNVGETHYPYALPDEPPDQWPRISGVHGVFKHLDDEVVGGKLLVKKDKFFDNKKMEALRQRQVEAEGFHLLVVEEFVFLDQQFAPDHLIVQVLEHAVHAADSGPLIWRLVGQRVG